MKYRPLKLSIIFWLIASHQLHADVFPWRLEEFEETLPIDSPFKEAVHELVQSIPTFDAFIDRVSDKRAEETPPSALDSWIYRAFKAITCSDVHCLDRRSLNMVRMGAKCSVNKIQSATLRSDQNENNGLLVLRTFSKKEGVWRESARELHEIGDGTTDVSKTSIIMGVRRAFHTEETEVLSWKRFGIAEIKGKPPYFLVGDVDALIKSLEKNKTGCED